MRVRILVILLTIVLLLITSVVVYSVLFLSTARVPTGSMANTIIPGDYIVVKKRAFGAIRRGNLILFRYPEDPSVTYLFRVIGLPGEKIEIKDRSVLIDGRELPERRVTVRFDLDRLNMGLEEISAEGDGPYRVFYSERDGLRESDLPSGGYGTASPFQIPDNQYFVMGDNRDNSQDSRFWGTVSNPAIVGKPTMIYWSSYLDQSGVEQPRWERLFKRVQ
jgi:signal peptidase I